MTQWDVVLVIVVLLGLIATVIGFMKPTHDLKVAVAELRISVKSFDNLTDTVQRLDKNLTALGEQAKDMEQDFNKHCIKNSESHGRLWDHNKTQDEKLIDHEIRIGTTEKRILVLEEKI